MYEMNNPNYWLSILLIIISATISISVQAIRSKLKRIEDAYEKLKNQVEQSINRKDLKELLDLYLKPLTNEISNIKDTLRKITKIKLND